MRRTRATFPVLALLLCAPWGAASAQDVYVGDVYVTPPSLDAPSRRAYEPGAFVPAPRFGRERIAAPYASSDPYPRGGDYGGYYEDGDLYDDYGQATGRVRGRARAVEAPDVAPRVTRRTVAWTGSEGPGTIVVDSKARRLYYVSSAGEAISYGVGVGRPGFGWTGTHQISAKREWPGWTPPQEMLRRRPDLPRHMAGGIDNPLGARAMYLGNTLYRIHGSNEPGSIGTAVSSGCIRMTNEDVTDLYDRVKVGTRVVVR